ncbi:MAG: lipopolysaccharide assembly protein LapB [Pseudomonadota bacterium]
MFSPVSFLFLLLPVAALSGWVIGRYGGRRRRSAATAGGRLSTEYLRGLGYLLEDRTDKAIDVFTRILEVDSETVEIHLALGSLFRRRGEVDRAIRIHQNLIARPNLSPEQRERALFELAQDHMSAGLFDRAEKLFEDLAERGEHVLPALRQLRGIYEQEKEWDAAIRVARRLLNQGDSDLGPVVAHYYCELAALAHQAGRTRDAERHLRQALGFDRTSVRATLMEGRLAMEAGSWRNAIKIHQRVAEQDPAFFSEAVPPLREAYEQMGRPLELIRVLQPFVDRHTDARVLVALTELLTRQQGPQQAAVLLCRYLAEHPNLPGLNQYVELTASHADDKTARDLEPVRTILEKMVADQPAYSCRRCGFNGRVLHWQCPSCKGWGIVKPTLAADTP